MRTDEELLAAWGGGDEAAGRELFDRYFEPLYRFFCNKVDDGVEDLIQETFLASVEARARFRGDASVRTFLFAIARKRLYKRWRRAHRDEILDFGVTSVRDLGLSPSRVVADREAAHQLLDGLRRIPCDLQIVLELYYWEGMSATEIGHVLDIPEGTARSRLRRAKEHLVAELHAGDSGTSPADDDLERWAAEIRAQLSLEASSMSPG